MPGSLVAPGCKLREWWMVLLEAGVNSTIAELARHPKSHRRDERTFIRCPLGSTATPRASSLPFLSRQQPPAKAQPRRRAFGWLAGLCQAVRCWSLHLLSPRRYSDVRPFSGHLARAAGWLLATTFPFGSSNARRCSEQSGSRVQLGKGRCLEIRGGYQASKSFAS